MIYFTFQLYFSKHKHFHYEIQFEFPMFFWILHLQYRLQIVSCAAKSAFFN